MAAPVRRWHNRAIIVSGRRRYGRRMIADGQICWRRGCKIPKCETDDLAYGLELVCRMVANSPEIDKHS